MGASESKSSEAFHVLMIQENSPASEAGLEPFFDFIVAINGIRLNQEDTTLVDVLKANLNKECTLTVYSSKTQEMRDATIVPSDNWGGVGLLGARIRYCSFEGASENIWHILTVYPNSPAEKAGLKAECDYIIATPDTLLHDQASFSELVEQSLDRDLRLYVYNSETDKTREVSITPTKSWGGKGSLGCDVGYGYLHRIPKRPSGSHPAPSGAEAPSAATSHSHSHGSDHSHSHGSDHSHSHGNGHSHSHGDGHAHSHGGEHDEEEEEEEDHHHGHSHSHGGSHGHSHSHAQEGDGYAEVPLVGALSNS